MLLVINTNFLNGGWKLQVINPVWEVLLVRKVAIKLRLFSWGKKLEVAPRSSDLSPHWQNISEDYNSLYGEGQQNSFEF